MDFRRLLIISLVFCGFFLLVRAQFEKDGQEVVTIYQFLENPASFEQLRALLKETQLDIYIRQEGIAGYDFTLFAPTDHALSQFGKVGLLRNPNNVVSTRNLLTDFVKYHLVQEKIIPRKLRGRREMKTLAGKLLKKKQIGKILYTVELPHGVIYVVDRVLINPDLHEVLKEEE